MSGRARKRMGSSFHYPDSPYHNTALHNRWHEGYEVGARLPERACPHWNTSRRIKGIRICDDCRCHVAERPQEEPT